VARPRCALAILPAEGGDPDRAIGSLHAATSFGLGDLAEVVPLRSTSNEEAQAALRQAAETAAADGCDWLLAMSAAETLSQDVFVKTTPALRLHDAIWGGAGLVLPEAVRPLERITRLAAQELPTFFHAALAWWIGPTHFVRPLAALAALAALRPDCAPGWYAAYLLHLWKHCRAYKTAQRLTYFHGTLPPVPASDRTRLVDALEREPVFMPVRYREATLWLPYTGVNPVIEREQARGLFFEDEELRFLAERLPCGLRIVDVGANAGNHTLFFAAVMRAETVVPIEPHPRAAVAIRAAVGENRLGNVDLSRLGHAVGARSGRLRPVASGSGGLGATRYVPDGDGPVPLAPLDILVPGPVDLLKVDVEGMEMAVLAGAAELIARHRPFLFIEVLDETIGEFIAWADAHAYRIERLFPDKTHCNYFVAPAEGRKGRLR
jgi:FkbM family methyltransferase